MSLTPPGYPCGNFPTRECAGICEDYCERFPYLEGKPGEGFRDDDD
jgi:hypothetical protein